MRYIILYISHGLYVTFCWQAGFPWCGLYFVNWFRYHSIMINIYLSFMVIVFFIAGYKCNRISVRQCQISLLTCKFFVMVVYYLSIDLLRIFSLINQQDKLTSTQKKYTRYILLTVVGGSPQVSVLKSKVIEKYNLVLKIRLVWWWHLQKKKITHIFFSNQL